MTFKKTAHAEVLGVQSKGDWSKVAGARVASFFMESGVLDVEAALDAVADTYQISRNPDDYLYIPVRANSADMPNENLDDFARDELLRFDPTFGQRVYHTYTLKPHFVNHNASQIVLSRGVLLDSHFNDANPMTDTRKRALFDATGLERDKDEFVEVLIAVDTTKDRALAEAYRNGSVYRFSMGCDVEATTCSACGNVATTNWQFCPCVRSKHARKPVQWRDGSYRPAFEWCNGTRFAELSVVDDPADKTAEIQEGLLQLIDRPSELGRAARQDLASFVARHGHLIPESLAPVFNQLLSE